MSLRIRLARGGAKKRPFYRIVIADSRSPRDGRFIEKIGTYNPMVPRDHPERLNLNQERAKHWLSVGATPSDRVARFLGQVELMPVPAIPQQTKKNQPKAKAQERMKEAEEAKQKAAEAPAAEEPAAEAAPAEEAPAEEAAPAAEDVPAEDAPAEELAAEAAEAPAEEEAPAKAAAEEGSSDGEAAEEDAKNR